jgi:hypothetical protein
MSPPGWAQATHPPDRLGACKQRCTALPCSPWSCRCSRCMVEEKRALAARRPSGLFSMRFCLPDRVLVPLQLVEAGVTRMLDSMKEREQAAVATVLVALATGGVVSREDFVAGLRVSTDAMEDLRCC